MFNKLLFNRNAYDRSVGSPSLTSTISTYGSMQLKLIISSTVPLRQISSNGDMSCKITMRQHVSSNIVGSGKLDNTDVLLRMKLQVNRIQGLGDFIPSIGVRVPIKGNVSGNGNILTDNRFRALQYINGNIKSYGNIEPQLMLQTNNPADIGGNSNMYGAVSLLVPLMISLNGKSLMTLRRLGGLNENILEFEDINLLPGETMTIDTELLKVMFGMREDVSSVTSDSIFFELSPGENELVISTDSNSELDVSVIWQNRWL